MSHFGLSHFGLEYSAALCVNSFVAIAGDRRSLAHTKAQAFQKRTTNAQEIVHPVVGGDEKVLSFSCAFVMPIAGQSDTK
jgi:hypothetical protein